MQCPKLDGWKGRQFLCLHCVHVCCKDHIKTHSQAGSHHLFVDISSTHVFCTKCDDYVYDPEFERVALAERCVPAHPNSPPVRCVRRFSCPSLELRLVNFTIPSWL